MSNCENSDGGCLSALTCGLFNRREKRPPDAPSSSQPIRASDLLPDTDSKPVNSELGPLSTQSPTLALHGSSDIANGDIDASILPLSQTSVKSTSVSKAGSTPADVAPAKSNSQSPEIKISLELWKDAYANVNDDTRKLIVDVPQIPDIKDFTKNLVELVRKQEKEYEGESRDLEVCNGKRKILWRDYAERVVSWLTLIGDIAIPFAPSPASAVWSGIKVVLNTNVSQCKELVSILGCTDLILSLLRRGRVYEKVHLTKSPFTDSQMELRDNLVRMYTECLDFLAHMLARFSQNLASQFLDALIDPQQSQEKVSNLQKWEQRLFNVALDCWTENIHLSNEEEKKLLHSLEEPLGRIRNSVTEVLEQLDKAERTDRLNFISEIKVGFHHEERKQLRTKDTCEWLIKHTKFREWEEASYSSLLWLQGGIGTGKSVLTSKVIDRYCVDRNERDKWSNNHDDALAYFYCSRSDPERRDIRSILRSFVRQLSEIPRRLGSIHKATLALTDDKEKVQKTCDLEAIKSAMVEIINSYPRTILVLDALDECNDETRPELAIFFKDIVAASRSVLKVFIASRKEAQIECHLGSPQSSQMSVYISTSDNQGDIEKFVNSEWEKFAKSPPFNVGEDIEKKVKDTLQDKSGGMFRWTYLQWEQIKACRSNSAVLDRLKCLPKTLSETYDEICHNLQDRERLMLQSAVRWVVCAQAPFDSCTLLSAIRAEFEIMGSNSQIHKSDFSEKNLESICRHLVFKDSQLGVWKFTHTSVLEYFEAKKEPWIEAAQFKMAAVVTRCLAKSCSIWPPKGLENTGKPLPEALTDYFNDNTGLDDVFSIRNPFQRYIQKNWFQHVGQLSQEDPEIQNVTQALQDFLGRNPKESSSQEYQVFCRFLLPHTGVASYSKASKNPHNRSIVHPVENVIFGIIAFGLHRALAGWWEEGLDISQKNANRQDLLTIASHCGHKDLCDFLIKKGANINKPVSDQGRGALLTAIAARQVEVAHKLLDEGANPNPPTDGATALCEAVTLSFGLVERLLTLGADPNLPCGNKCIFGCPLSRASFFGRLPVMELLIREKANVNLAVPTDKFGCPLGTAVAVRNQNAARLLHGHSAEVDRQLGPPWGSILGISVLRPTNTIMLQFLVEILGADVNLLIKSPPDPKKVHEMGKVTQEKFINYFTRRCNIDYTALKELGF